VGGDSSSVDDPFGDPLVVEFGNLFSGVKVVQDRRASFTSLDTPRGFLYKEGIARIQGSAIKSGGMSEN
jgi:hypothetical protein